MIHHFKTGARLAAKAVKRARCRQLTMARRHRFSAAASTEARKAEIRGRSASIIAAGRQRLGRARCQRSATFSTPPRHGIARRGVIWYKIRHQQGFWVVSIGFRPANAYAASICPRASWSSSERRYLRECRLLDTGRGPSRGLGFEA